MALERLVQHLPRSSTEDTVLAALGGGGDVAAVVVGDSNGDRSEKTEEKIYNSAPPDGMVPFYLSPTTLRRLAPPIASLLTDPRSTVVKHACQHLALLVERTGAAPLLSATATADTSTATAAAAKAQQRPDRARHLLRDLLPTILSMHGQTVNIIRGYATSMMLVIIPLCRFKSALPIVLDALRKNKSRDVREACARYLRAVLDGWSGTVSVNSAGVAVPYVTRDVATHIGNALARALMDPSQAVRMEARLGFETFRGFYPAIWENCVHRDGGPLSKDYRLKKSIINAAVRADAEKAVNEGVPGHGMSGGHVFAVAADDDDRSVDSSFSYQSGASGISKASCISYSSRMGIRSARGGGGAGPPPGRSAPVPRAVSTRPGGSSKIPAPSPRRRPGSSMTSPNRKSSLPSLRTPPKPAASSKLAMNAFASIIESPAPVGTKSRDHLLAVDPKIHSRAATSIQAAFRGVVTRKSILPAEALVESENINGIADPPTLPKVTSTDSSELSPVGSPEVNMIKAARRAVDASSNGINASSKGRKSLIGNTARMMANRRKTIGAKDSSAISPLRTQSPSNDEFRKPFASPYDSRKQETPTAAGKASRLGWMDESPVKSIAFDAADMTKARKSKVRDRKSSIMLQQRLRQSSIGGAVNTKLPNGRSKGVTPLSPCVEHVDIARELLSAHRSHIDGLMATLRMEMDVVRDFETILQDGEESDRPTEDDVLDYFESMQMCLDERTEMGNTLRKQLDQISQG